jgi:hypothetical protein
MSRSKSETAVGAAWRWTRLKLGVYRISCSEPASLLPEAEIVPADHHPVLQDAQTILARVPPSSGLASETIIVTNPDGQSGQLSNAFHYRWQIPAAAG